MFRLAKVVFGVTVTTGAAGLAVERGCKLRSYSDPTLFKYVKFGLTTQYCATMISADPNNFRYGLKLKALLDFFNTFITLKIDEFNPNTYLDYIRLQTCSEQQQKH